MATFARYCWNSLAASGLVACGHLEMLLPRAWSRRRAPRRDSDSQKRPNFQGCDDSRRRGSHPTPRLGATSHRLQVTTDQRSSDCFLSLSIGALDCLMDHCTAHGGRVLVQTTSLPASSRATRQRRCQPNPTFCLAQTGTLTVKGGSTTLVGVVCAVCAHAQLVVRQPRYIP